MKIKIIYDKNQIKKKLNFIEECIPHFERNKMFFYFPFDNTSKKDSLIIDEQIKKDEEKFKIKSTKEKIVKAWKEKESAVLNFLEKYNKKNIVWI
ncbi:MAG: hypothetical protein U9O55_00915 [Patescibacteria group bacterium]|nr:hypothetical protein [Patescibacteria group bacterium]